MINIPTPAVSVILMWRWYTNHNSVLHL